MGRSKVQYVLIQTPAPKQYRDKKGRLGRYHDLYPLGIT
jgi:hypothetical protein